MSEELKPCPFCGGEATIEIKERAYSICGDSDCCGMGDMIIIECSDCLCEMKIPSPYFYKRKVDIQEAIAAWNRRTTDAQLQHYQQAEAEGRLRILTKHKIEQGTLAWTIDHHGKIQKGEVSYCEDGYAMYFWCASCGFPFYNYHIGKTVFLTREAAEQALKEREGK